MFFSPDYMIYYVLTIIISIIGGLVSSRLKQKFSYYAQVPLSNRMSGREVAESMLRYYNIRDVQVVEGQGFLSDHYNPLSKTVSLSPDVYRGRSVASAAVAAHECGHAVQHDTAYSMLKVRSSLVPILKVAAPFQQFLIIVALMSAFEPLLLLTIIVFGVSALFSLVTLPVEFDASKRALVWLDETGITHGQEYDGAKDALWWAAMTYVTAALSSLIILVFLILRYMSASDR